jgi:hypothetical protein
MKPLKREPQFDHVNYQHTNLRVTFARIRRRMAQEAEAKVVPIKRKERA